MLTWGYLLQAERDVLSQARRELERRVEQREAQLLDKDEELFLQLERVVRLEDECDKVTPLLISQGPATPWSLITVGFSLQNYL